MSADAIVKSFIDRVLRLKEEQDALSADIREVYAEAKGNGYDKTAMGEVVAYLRKIEKKGKDAVAERSAMFDLYLDAYERPSHTHAREGQSYAEAKGHLAVSAEQTARDTMARFPNIMNELQASETGEITDTQEQTETASQSADMAVGLAGPACGQDADAANIKPAPNPHSSDDLPVETDKAGEAVTSPAVSPVDLSDDDVPAFLRKSEAA